MVVTWEGYAGVSSGSLLHDSYRPKASLPVVVTRLALRMLIERGLHTDCE